MLQKNQRIYAILICFIGGTKYFIDSAFFDGHLLFIQKMDFLWERVLIIGFNTVALFSLYTIVRDEIGEIIQKMDPAVRKEKVLKEQLPNKDIAHDYSANFTDEDM